VVRELALLALSQALELLKIERDGVVLSILGVDGAQLFWLRSISLIQVTPS
jgi:hypothetical protein